MDNGLKAKASSMSPFLKVAEGEIKKIDKFVSWREISDKFRPTENTMEYTFEVEGKIKTMTSKSSTLALLLSTLKKDQPFYLKKTGTGFQTKWEVYNVKTNGSIEEKLQEETERKVESVENPDEIPPF